MKNLPLKRLKSGVAGTQRRSMASNPKKWVTSEPLLPGKSIPRLITPTEKNVELHDWVNSNADYVQMQFREHRALLFRGFSISTTDAFSRFVDATSNGELLEYRDRSTPRENRGTRIYTSTVFPADQRINLHNEGTYWKRWALKIYFCCLVAAEQGGATPIADVRKVYQRIPPDIRDRFIEKQIMYVRNYNDGFGLAWQEVFQTQDRSEVEAYCRTNGIEFEWKEGERLRTRQVRPAVRNHPETGEPVWFNHGAFFHAAALAPSVRETLMEEFGAEGLPYHTLYGDGSPIADESVRTILDCYRAEQVVFSWQPGDVLMQDNMAIAHAREPYVGDREVLTAMTDAYSDSDD